MSQFVNYNKRGVQLPSGCKNLIDVIKQPGGQGKKDNTDLSGSQLVPFRSESFTDSLVRVENRVSTLFGSNTVIFRLLIETIDEKANLQFGRDGNYTSAVIAFVQDIEREKEVREFFVAHKLTLPEQEFVAASEFIPQVPIFSLFPIMPEPVDTISFLKLADAFLRKICGLDDKSAIKCSYIEFKRAL